MPELDDHQLLAEFVRCHSEAAFTELVRRYGGLVYSTALRFCSNPHHAEEITQAVFVVLARKAEALSPRVVVSGWLYQTARLTAANFVKGEIRRRHREQEAVMQCNPHETDSSAWEKIAPLLDEAMGALAETDRSAVLLRYFENRTSQEIGAALRMNEETARKRVNRALEKLRQFFAKRGVTVSGATLSGALSTHSIQPISAVMAKTISAVAIANGATASASTLTLIKGALKIMAWTKAKTAVVAVTAVILATGTTTVIVKRMAAGPARIAGAAISDSFFELDSRKLFGAPPGLVILRSSRFDRGGQIYNCSDGKTTRISGKKVSLADVIGMAYGVSQAQMVIPADFPEGEFDFLVTVPEKPQEELQAEIKKQFGLVGRREMRETDALVLLSGTPGAAGLKRSLGGNPVMGANGRQVYWNNQPISALANFLEEQFKDELKRPVIDRTGLKGGYDFAFEMNALESNQNLKRAVQDKLGLELVPGREPIEMLVVEKVK